jgi:hypothetical protein
MRSDGKRHVRAGTRLVTGLAAAAILALTLGPAPRARADGDPASDVLIGESVFYPYSPAVSAGLQNKLNAEAAAAAHARFPIKIALIASPPDLGAIPVLFDRPQQYARFLEQEISFLGHTPQLLVVMPDGYGVQGLSPAATAAVASLAKPAGTQSNDLASAAITAVHVLAAAAGHPIKTSDTSSAVGNGDHSSALLAIVLALAAVGVAASILVLRARPSLSWSDGAQPRGRRELATRQSSGGHTLRTQGSRADVVQARLVIGLVLVLGGVSWAVVRGVEFYGLTPANLAYDLDQPPVLLMLVGGWLLYRSSRR